MFHKKDYENGHLQEIKLLSLLRSRFSESLELTDRFHSFDYHSEKDKIFIELKSRTNMKEKYDTTMIGYNKIEKARQYSPEYKIYFFFQFNDGLYYWLFNEVDLLNFEIRDGGRYDRKCGPEISKYVYIPVKFLKNI